MNNIEISRCSRVPAGPDGKIDQVDELLGIRYFLDYIGLDIANNQCKLFHVDSKDARLKIEDG